MKPNEKSAILSFEFISMEKGVEDDEGILLMFNEWMVKHEFPF